MTWRLSAGTQGHVPRTLPRGHVCPLSKHSSSLHWSLGGQLDQWAWEQAYGSGPGRGLGSGPRVPQSL